MSRIIVKVQASTQASEIAQQVLVYSEDNSVWFHVPMTKPVRRVLKGRRKAFFFAARVTGKNLVELQEEAPWQAW